MADFDRQSDSKRKFSGPPSFGRGGEGGRRSNGNGSANGSHGGGGGQALPAAGMPQSLEAERVVLGSMLIDNTTTALAVESLGSGDPFYSDSHREIYAAILSLVDAGTPADPSTVALELERLGRLERVGGGHYLAKLETCVLSPGNLGAHAKIIVDKWQLRRLIETCRGIAEEAAEESETVQNLLEEAERSIFSIASTRRSRETLDIATLAREALDDIERRSKDHRDVTGVPTGYPDLDAKTSGLQKTDLIILAARPSMGKTAFALNICQNVAGLGARKEPKIPVALFSLEMSARQLTQRVLASIARVNLHKLRSGRVDGRTMDILEDKAAELAAAPLIIEDAPGLSILELRSRARRIASQRPDLGLIMIDYLQLMSGGKRVESRQQEVSEISRSLKSLGRELNVPILALSQLSRQTEQRSGKDKRPVLSDLRESGAIEQDADVVMFVHREDYYNRKEKDAQPGGPGGPGQNGAAGKQAQAFAPEISEIIIGKQRNGPTGVVELLFLPDIASFMPISRQHAGRNEGPF